MNALAEKKRINKRVLIFREKSSFYLIPISPPQVTRGFGVLGFWGFLCFFNVFPSVVFVEWGGEFIVKLVEIEGFAIGPLRTFQENHDEKVGFGR